MNANTLSPSHNYKWYESCGEVFFTQLIIPFFDDTSRDLKSLAQTCKFIYQQYTHCDDLWKSLLLKEYPDLSVEELNNETLTGKLMNLFYQLLYYENNVDQIPKQTLLCHYSKKREVTAKRPNILCASSQGSYYGEGFISMLVYSSFSDEFEPFAYTDNYLYNLKLDDSYSRKISLLAVSLYEEYPQLMEHYTKTTDGIIYSIIITEDQDIKNVKSLFEGFNSFYENLCKCGLLNRYIVSIILYYKGQDVDSHKKRVEEEVRKYIGENYKLKICLIMECNLMNRNEVENVAIQVVKRYKSIDANLFMQYMINQASEKKKCFVM